ncbi:MAG: hypothetical protein H6Q21_2044 [Bacteroidetes bacterium]|jgi:hypothetical protein|nr:hypothetical protein [Bacteroidota bacterium]
MTLQIKEVQSKRDLKKFIYLPEEIHRHHKNWIPPLYMDEWDFYNPAKNSAFRHSTTILLLAYRDNKPVGRIMGIINHKYNKTHNETHARFFNLECWEDPETASTLITAIENWARKNGMTKLIGPLGFSDKDPQGFMIEGFDNPMAVATNCSLPYMPSLIENCGYTKEVDLVSYKVDIPDGIPQIYNTVYERVKNNGDFSVLEFTTKKELRKYIRPVFELINETYAEIYGFAELEPDEMDFMANRYMLILNPKFIKVILDKNRKIAAFIVGMPEMAEGIRKARGRMFPFGFIKILREGKRSKMLTLYLGAVKEEYRGNGLDALMGIKMLDTAKKEKMAFMDSHLVLETNTRMRREYERLAGVIYKKYRIYKKEL